MVGNGGSYICNKTTLEVERSLTNLLSGALLHLVRKVKEGYRDATRALARLTSSGHDAAVMCGLGLVGFCSF